MYTTQAENPGTKRTVSKMSLPVADKNIFTPSFLVKKYKAERQKVILNEKAKILLIEKTFFIMI